MVKLLRDNGFVLERINGSHHIMKKGVIEVSVPVHAGKDLRPGTQHRILKEAGLK